VLTNNPPTAPPSEPRPQETSWETLDRQDWQLWILAIVLIVVFAGSLLVFMFPTVFWSVEGTEAVTPKRAFFGLCVLLVLTLAYLLQKQAKLRQLKRELVAAQTALAKAEREAAIESFKNLPSMSQFRDTLAMEFRRASTSGDDMAVLLFNASSISLEELGRMTHLLRSMLRQGETQYRISDKAIGVILPGMKLSNGASFAAQLEALSGVTRRDLEVTITAYPEDVSSLAELERKLRGQNQLSPPPEIHL
jgi:GGDEF domain-containing protein